MVFRCEFSVLWMMFSCSQLELKLALNWHITVKKYITSLF